jgi:hypothetical protein
MDTVRIGFFLGELYVLSCWACDIENAFLYAKTKEKVYITAGPEFVVDLHSKSLIIDKSLYGLKTSAARFHEHLSQSLLRWKCGVPWRSMEESAIRISSFSKDLH